MIEELGKCLEIAFCNVIKNPQWLFCYGQVKWPDKEGTYLHAWNETREGNIIDSSEKNEVKMPKTNYYVLKGVEIETVKKLDIKAMISKMNEELKKEDRLINIWGWIQ